MWTRTLITAYRALFFLSWATFLASFLCFLYLRATSASRPTAERPVAIKDHGARYYVTRSQERTYRGLLTGGAAGIGTVLVLGFLLQFGARVPLFSEPEPRERR